MRAHELRSVQKGETLLGLKADRLPTHFVPDLLARADLAFVENLSESNERKAEVGEGSEVSGRTQRTLLIDNRQDVVVEHVQKSLDSDQLRSGMAVGQGLGFQQEHQPHDLRAYRLAGSAGMGHHQIVLKPRKLVGRDGDVAQRAESGGHSIDRTSDVLHLAVQVLAAFLNGSHGLRAEFDRFVVLEYGLEPLKAQMFV